MQQITALFSNWIRIAGALLIGGALAWTMKLAVIISTNGRVINTGAAAFLMTVGLVTIVVGSTGIGSLLTRNRNWFLRTLAIVLSPALVFSSILLLGFITGPLYKNTSIWYAEQEAPIALAVLVCGLIGTYLYRNKK